MLLLVIGCASAAPLVAQGQQKPFEPRGKPQNGVDTALIDPDAGDYETFPFYKAKYADAERAILQDIQRFMCDPPSRERGIKRLLELEGRVSSEGAAVVAEARKRLPPGSYSFESPPMTNTEIEEMSRLAADEITTMHLRIWAQEWIDEAVPRRCPPQAAAVPMPPPSGPPPGANPPCRTKNDDSEYVRLDAELERLSQEHDKFFLAATNPSGKAALNENNRQIEEVIKKKDAIRARQPCVTEPKAVQVPPANEHGMAPTQQGGPGFPFGFGGGSFGFGFGGGSDDVQRDRGFGNDPNRRR